MKQGFTLIELLVIVGIITIFTSIILPNYRLGAGTISLERSAHALSQEIRAVQGMAMASREIGPEGQEFYPQGGFGIYFKTQNQEITVFADCNANQKIDQKKVCGSKPNEFSETIKSIQLEPGVRLFGLSPSSPLTVIFQAPDPLTIISGGQEATITLSLDSDASKTKNIKINSAGLIYVE